MGPDMYLTYLTCFLVKFLCVQCPDSSFWRAFKDWRLSLFLVQRVRSSGETQAVLIEKNSWVNMYLRIMGKCKKKLMLRLQTKTKAKMFVVNLVSLDTVKNIRINTGVQCTQSCPTLCDTIDFSLPGSSLHEIFQERELEWVTIYYSRESSHPRDQTHISWISWIASGIFMTSTTWDA